MDNQTQTKPGYKRWLKNMGIGAVAFFAVKGLIWLGVFFGLFKFVGC
jgi:hypothetical protein